MSSIAATADVYRPRRIHYVDARIQQWLLLALVALEAVLTGATVVLVGWRLSAVIEENLYRVHLAEAGRLLDQLIPAALNMFGVFVVVNVIALLVADVIWRYYVGSVVRDFMTLIGKTGKLDFSSDSDAARHEVLALAAAWRARERERLAAVRVQVGRLQSGVSAGRAAQSMRDALDKLDELLREPSVAVTNAWGHETMKDDT